jgi:hypothetical protein
MKSSVKITIHSIETIFTTFIKKDVFGKVFNNSVSYNFNDYYQCSKLFPGYLPHLYRRARVLGKD